MHVARERFLAGAGLALDQHGRIGGRDAFELRLQRLHRLAVADRLGRRGQLAAQAVVLLAQAAGLERAREREQQLRARNGFLDEVVGAEPRRLDRRLDGAVAGHHDDRATGAAALAPFAQQRDAVGVRHPDVQQHEVRATRAALLARRCGVARGKHGKTFILEGVLHRLADIGFIVDDEDRGRDHAGLSRKRDSGG